MIQLLSNDKETQIRAAEELSRYKDAMDALADLSFSRMNIGQ
jgi:hypothetical protein